MHLIPSFILLVVLIMAWKWELIGGIIFIIIGIGMSPFVFTLNYERNHFSINECPGVILMITSPFVIVDILFIIAHFMKNKSRISTR